jgi:hypothetical protein
MYENQSHQETSFHQSRIVQKSASNNRIKPKFFKLMGQIMNYHIEVKKTKLSNFL